VRYMVRNLRCTVTIDSVLANSKTQNAFLFTVHAIFRHDYPLAVEPASTPRPLVQKTLRDSLLIDMLLSAVSFLVFVQSSSEVPEGLMNNPVFGYFSPHNCKLTHQTGIRQEKCIIANVLFPQSNATPICVFSLTTCFGEIFCHHQEKFYTKMVNHSYTFAQRRQNSLSKHAGHNKYSTEHTI